MGEILVTGGAGFIGTHTCIALLQAGYSVVILDNLCNAKQESLLHLQEITGKSIPFYHMDIRNADGLRQIFQTHLFCRAALRRTESSWRIGTAATAILSK